MVNVLFESKKNKCSICGRKAYRMVNGVPLCIAHYVKEYYGKNKGCLEAHLDMLIEDMIKGRELDSDEKQFLKEVKKQFPDIAEEYPRIFENL